MRALSSRHTGHHVRGGLMNPLIVSASAAALVFGGACLGLHLHRIRRPEHANLVAWMVAIFVSFGPKAPRN
jgi:hypothetical protein